MVLSTMSFSVFAEDTDIIEVGTGKTYETWSAAVAAATDEDGDKAITYHIYGKVEVDSTAVWASPRGTSDATTINFVGMTEDAEISITADGYTRRFVVKAERKANLENLVLSHSELVLGVEGSKKLSANVFPAEAWTEDMEITFTTENTDIISLETGNSTNAVMVRGLKEGTAIVTAAVKGTQLTATCMVTVEKVFSEEEKAVLIENASNNYVLVNAYPQKAATLKDVVLPDGWSWADDSMKLTADNAAKVQYYTAAYKAEGAQAFTAAIPVAVSEVTAVSIAGNTKMAAGNSG